MPLLDSIFTENNDWTVSRVSYGSYILSNPNANPPIRYAEGQARARIMYTDTQDNDEQNNVSRGLFGFDTHRQEQNIVKFIRRCQDSD
mgnify:CR=1 FL=1